MQFFMQFFAFLSKFFVFTGKIGSTNVYADPLSPDKEKELFSKLISGSTQQKIEAEELLCKHNLRLVVHVAKKFKDSKLSQDELVSIGSIGLLKAIRTYSPDKANFSTYASRCIGNEILMFFRMNKRNNNEISLSEPVGTDKDGNTLTLVDVLCETDDKVERETFARIELENVLNQIKIKLDDREKKVLSLRFGLFGEVPHTQREVSKILKISRSYVSRIETKAISKLS